ncbi:PQQ-dependent sugar dehydrogenase [Pedobacter sp. SD-b]|uniref:PQQ-dependent sugar dehydrogenase n=2 Tax=Pedobacter segetis TaxID=2793069 RepID=A0ABS1BMC8_9SPHI|nr:PQQ-dependent sugar dehydrogenase [Pedobacter segetis]
MAMLKGPDKVNKSYLPIKKTESLIDNKEAAANYKNYCSGCHGEKMDAFVDRKWKYGNGREDLFKAIKNGYPDDGMPSFSKTFTDKQIFNLSDYILTGIENIKKYTNDDKPKSNIFKTKHLTVRLDTVYAKGEVPWSMAFLPDGGFLVTDRAGTLNRVSKNKEVTEIKGVPPVRVKGQGGLLDVVLHPDFAKNNLLYLSYSKFKEEDKKTYATTAIMQCRLVGDELVDQKDIFVALPYATTAHHFGGRMAFGADGYLYFSVGTRGDETGSPQNLIDNSLGKIHRIKADGSIPSDNPFVNDKNVVPSIYTFGHRNPQGLALNPKDNTIWEHEHGPRGGDELNIIGAKKNYGWSIVSYGINYDGTTFTNKTEQEGIEPPIKYWIPSIAPSGMAFVNTKIYKGWEDNLMIGSLRFEYLDRCVLKNNKVVEEEILFKNIGRVRDIRLAPDGYLYMAVENPGRVYKIVPVGK